MQLITSIKVLVHKAESINLSCTKLFYDGSHGGDLDSR